MNAKIINNYNVIFILNGNDFFYLLLHVKTVGITTTQVNI